MDRGETIVQLFERTASILKKAAALTRDFTCALDDKGYVQHSKQRGDIIAYGKMRKLTEPENWLLTAFCMVYRRKAQEEQEKAKRLVCFTVVFFDPHHATPCVKLGICEIDKEGGWGPLGSTEGWYVYHPMGVWNYEGNIEFSLVKGSEYLVEGKPRRAKKEAYSNLGKITYFAVPLLSVASPDDVIRLCVDPVVALDTGLDEGVAVECFEQTEARRKMTRAVDLPEVGRARGA